MRCSNGHENADVEIFCSTCAEIMPALGPFVVRTHFRWIAEPEPHARSSAPPIRLGADAGADGEDLLGVADDMHRDHAVPGLSPTRAELRRRRHSWRRRLRVRRRRSSR